MAAQNDAEVVQGPGFFYQCIHKLFHVSAICALHLDVLVLKQERAFGGRNQVQDSLTVDRPLVVRSKQRLDSNFALNGFRIKSFHVRGFWYGFQQCLERRRSTAAPRPPAYLPTLLTDGSPP